MKTIRKKNSNNCKSRKVKQRADAFEIERKQIDVKYRGKQIAVFEKKITKLKGNLKRFLKNQQWKIGKVTSISPRWRMFQNGSTLFFEDFS